MAFSRHLFLIFAFIFAADLSSAASLLPACGNQVYQTGENYQSYYQQSGRAGCMKDWAVLIYMAADNELTPYALWDLYEMESRLTGEANLGASTASVDVVVELDTFARTGVQRYHIFQGNETYDPHLRLEDFQKKSEKDIHSPLVKWFPETGEGSLRNQKKRFQEFLLWSQKKYPAKKYMVVIWGHGEGYIGQHSETPDLRELLPREKATSNLLNRDMVYLDLLDQMDPAKFVIAGKPFGGVAFDYSDKTYLDIPSIRKILADFNQHRGKDTQVEILAFDACLMQSLEVATELMDVASYLVGSEQIQNYLGLPYRKLLDSLQRSPESYTMAKQIPLMVGQAYADGGYQAVVDPKMARTFTVSTLILSEMRRHLLPAMLELSQALKAYLEEDFTHPMELSYILQESASFRGEGRDLGIFLGTILKLLYEEERQRGLSVAGEELRSKVQNTLQALQRSMASYAYGDAYVNPGTDENRSYLLGFFKGVTVWIPGNPDLFLAREKEMSTAALFTLKGSEPKWQDWLSGLLSPVE
ncbi:MAG: hypothetical protein A2X86_22210 [Bdellovibrionales bacterium GWA2_49_15]|nr:MAG: hypothetical protein A2X86_22210 [Bdellovibrionales bacterium GWA2_49_15]HAZ14807.1 hypothetical protein [Bdellovibrionales bacterium]